MTPAAHLIGGPADGHPLPYADTPASGLADRLWASLDHSGRVVLHATEAGARAGGATEYRLGRVRGRWVYRAPEKEPG